MHGYTKYSIVGLLLLLPLISWGKTIIRYDIQGINDPLLKNVTTMLNTEETNVSENNQLNDPATVRQFFNQTPKIIKNALQPYGYFNPVIHSELQQNKDKWTFKYVIYPGPAVKVRNLKIKIVGPGANNPIFTQWRANVPLKIGQIFNVPDYNTTRSSFLDLCQEQGYLQATVVSHKLDIDVNTLSATIDLQLNTGPQYFFGAVTFSKTTKLSDEFLHRFVNIQEGAPFSISQVLQLQENLSNSGYFKKVDVLYDIKQAKDYVIPIQINLTPDDTMLYSLGVGYGTDTGYRASAGWQWQTINSAGHHMSTEYNISQIGNSTSVTYYIPGAQPLTEQYQLNVTAATYDTDAGRTWFQSYSGFYTKTMDKWSVNPGLTYQFEKYIIPNLTPQSVHLVMPSMTVSYLNTDHILRPTYGFRFSVVTRGATDKLISDVNFAQIQIDMRHLWPINDDNRMLFRSTIGGITTSNFNLVPLSLQFTAGGAQSIRGFAYQSLGPAQYLLVMSAEYQYRVYGDWFAALFHDGGNAFNNPTYPGLVQSGGAGVVWQSPIGTMELDLAKAINNPNPIMLQFSIGGLL